MPSAAFRHLAYNIEVLSGDSVTTKRPISTWSENAFTLQYQCQIINASAVFKSYLNEVTIRER